MQRIEGAERGGFEKKEQIRYIPVIHETMRS